MKMYAFLVKFKDASEIVFTFTEVQAARVRKDGLDWLVKDVESITEIGGTT